LWHQRCFFDEVVLRLTLALGFAVLVVGIGCGTATIDEESVGVDRARVDAPVIPPGNQLPSLGLPIPTNPGAPVPNIADLTPHPTVREHCHSPPEHQFAKGPKTTHEAHLAFTDKEGKIHVITVLYNVGGEPCQYLKDWNALYKDCATYISVTGNITAPQPGNKFPQGTFHFCADKDGQPLAPTICRDSPVGVNECKPAAAPPKDPKPPEVTGPNVMAPPTKDPRNDGPFGP